MLEGQSPGVQGDALGPQGVLLAPGVLRLPDQGGPGVGEVHPDLVGAAGDQVDLDRGRPGVLGERPVAREGPRVVGPDEAVRTSNDDFQDSGRLRFDRDAGL